MTERDDEILKDSDVRLQNYEGKEVGVMPFTEAFDRCQEYNMDLVEIAANAKPPVVRVMDYSKFIYEQKKQAKEAKKLQATNKLKEVKFHINTELHDYNTKCEHARKFIAKGYKLKITIQYRGREQAHKHLGVELMKRIREDLIEICQVDMEPKLQGRNYLMMLSPLNKKK